MKGRNILLYDTQALGKRHFKQTDNLLPSGLPLEIATCVTEWRQLAQVRIVPRLDGYMVEVVYEQQEEQAEVDPQLVAALDPGVNVLAALTSNKPGFVTRLVSGKPLEKPQPVLQQTTRKAPKPPEPRAPVHLAAPGSDHE